MRVVICTLIVLCVVVSVNSTTIHVPADQPTIQAGINAAVNGDTVLVAPGTYSGSGNKNITFAGKSILVTSASGAEQTVLDLSGSGPLIYFIETTITSPRFVGFTVTNSANSPYVIFCIGASLSIAECVFVNNSPIMAVLYFNGNSYFDAQPGISKSSPSPSVSGCTFVNNGGGYGQIYIQYNGIHVNISNCIFFQNHNSGDVIRLGGDATFSVACSDIYGNSSGDWVGGLAGFAGINGNVSLDPQFCSYALRDLTLMRSSPLADSNNSCQSLIGALPIGCGMPATLRVPSEYATIQAAIDASIDGDTVLVAPGVYAGVGNYDIDLRGKGILVASSSGPNSTIIDCLADSLHLRNGFLLLSGEDSSSVLQGFTIQNPHVGVKCTGIESLPDGGPRDAPKILDCIIENSLSTGLEFSLSAAKVIGCRVSHSQGAAMFVSACSLSVRSCVFNFSVGIWWNNCAVIVTEFGGVNQFDSCTFSDNFGTGILIGGWDNTLRNCLVERNGLHGILSQKEDYTDNLSIISSTVRGNKGAGILFSAIDGVLKVRNTTITENRYCGLF